MTRDEAEEFMHEWGDWAKWSDARAMVQEAFSRGFAAGKKDAAAAGVNAPDGSKHG